MNFSGFLRGGLLLMLSGFFCIGLQAQHFSITTHTNSIPRVVDFSDQNITLPNEQNLGLDLRFFSKDKWVLRTGIQLSGANLYDDLAAGFNYYDNYNYSQYNGPDRGGWQGWDEGEYPPFRDEWNWDDDWDDDWDECEFNPVSLQEQFGNDIRVVGEVGIERHIFLMNEKLDIYPGVYVPIWFSAENGIQQTVDDIRSGAIANDVGLTLGASVRVLRIFRIGVEFDGNFSQTWQGITQGIQDGNSGAVRRVPYQTAMTFGLAF